MATILIPTNDQAILPDVTQGYHSHGHSVVAGMCNMWLRTFQPDAVHFLWPEEFTNWAPPGNALLKRIEASLDHWRDTTRTIFSVNNLYPHGFEQNAAYHDLYSMFLEKCQVTLHHSATSHRLTKQRYPVSRSRHHIESTMFAYDRFLNKGADRNRLRNEIGLKDSDFAYLVFGGLRTAAETRLLQSAFKKCTTRNKRLVMAGRYQPSGGFLSRNVNRRLWQNWLHRTGALHGFGFIPDDEIYKYFVAADAIIIPRLDDLSSGVVGLGMTFGKLMIAPNHGAFPDYLAGTPNLLYHSGDADSLAEEMAGAPVVEAQRVEESNRSVAESWTWHRIAADGLSAIGLEKS